jgi:hypothetical protein
MGWIMGGPREIKTKKEKRNGLGDACPLGPEKSKETNE